MNFSQLLHTVDVFHIIEIYGYTGLFAVTFLESSFFFPLPGDSLLFTAGLVASKGYLPISYVMVVFFLATFSGGVLGYFIGARISFFHKYKLFRSLLSHAHIRVAHQFFETHSWSVFLLYRFVPVVRTFVPIAAGISRVNFKAFVLQSACGALVWSSTVPLLGFFLGKKFPQIQNYISLIFIVIILFSVLPIIKKIATHYWKKRK